MAETRVISGIRIELGYDSEAAWKNASNKITLNAGELIGAKLDYKIGKSNYALILSDGSTSISDTFNKGDCFYSGIGAGYVLPIAGNDGVTPIGGIRLDNDTYFNINQTSGILSPTFLSWENTLARGSTYNLKSENGFVVDGNIYCKELHGTTVVKNEYSIIQTQSDYIDLNTYDADLNPNTLTGNETAGIKFHNYLEREQDVYYEDRTVAELSVDSKGVLSYNKGANKGTVEQQVLTLERTWTNVTANKFLYVTENSINGYTVNAINKIPVTNIDYKPLTIKIDGVEADEYTPSSVAQTINISVPTSYCKSLTIEGVSYSCVNNVIALPIKAFTQEKENKLNSAVQEITINEMKFTGSNITLPTIKSNSGIVPITKSEANNTIELTHSAPTGFQAWKDTTEWPITDVNSTETIQLVSDLKYDDTGHIISYGKIILSFAALIQRIQTLESKLASLK